MGPTSSDKHRRPPWVRWGALVMAALAALSLGVAVFFAWQALHGASEVMARGEANTIVSKLQSDFSRSGDLSQPAMERALDRYGDKGLRYVAIVWGSESVSSGEARIESRSERPGDFTMRAGRVRLVDWVAPKDEGAEMRTSGGFDEVLHAEAPPPVPPVLVVELETPVSKDLRSDMRHMILVSTCAVVGLLAFAVAWLRGARRVEQIEARAEHQRRLVALGEMSSVIAHELRNPLTALKGHAQLLAESLESSPAEHRNAERVVHEAERIELLTASLLEFVREGPLEWGSITSRDLVDQVLDGVKDKERVDVQLACAPQTLRLDRDRAARAIRNLVENALTLAPTQPVELSIAGGSGSTIIEVRDRGPGLPPEGDRIFEPFVTTRTKGTGLGLAIARRTIEQHGGTLTAQTRPTGGALFRMTLPNVA